MPSLSTVATKLQVAADEAVIFHTVAAKIADAQAEINTLLGIDPATDLDPVMIYDGPGGITSDSLYYRIRSWGNKGGDWLDADGVFQGQKPFGSATIATGQTGTVSVDVTALVQQGGEPSFCLRGQATTSAAPAFAFQSREGGTGSALAIDYADGTTDRIPVMFDVESNPTTAYQIGKQAYLTVSDVVKTYLRFAQPTKPVAKATLLLTIVKCYAPGLVNVFKFALQRDPIPTERMVLKGDPRVFFETESFEDAPKYIRAPIYDDPLHNVLDKYDQRNAVDVVGGRALQVTFDPRANGACYASVCFPNFDEADEAAVEFDIRLMPDLLTGLADGVKLFAGFSSSTKNDDAYFAAWSGTNTPGRCGTLLAGNGGAKSHGYDGWSMRWDMWQSPPAPHPLHGRFMPMQYQYWPGQTDFYGDPLTWNLNGRSIPAGEWTTITQRLKVNSCVGTDYKQDAEFDGYINHVLAARRRNFYLRTTDTPLIALPPYNVRSKLAIGRIWINSYHGGTAFPLSRCSFQVRNFRAAKFA